MSGPERLPLPDVVVRARAQVGEGPVFDARTGRLCWVDINERTLFETDLSTGEQRETDVGLLLGAAVPREREPGFAVAVADGLGLWTDGALDLREPVLPEPHRRMNDAKCDSRGRLWAGSNHMEFAPGGGALHRWDGRGPSAVVRDGFTLPNGIGWTVEDDTMYFADTFAYTLYRADFDADEGEVGPFSVHCTFGEEWPDGLAVDVEGCVWVAFWGSSEVRRIDPRGEVVAVVPMPVTQPSSCAFGDDGTLYITSACAGLSEEELAAQPLAGSVFAVATATSGVPVHPFAA
ncbi:MAG TPA: SMP-30/gluconolactonase/LRE family protein [Gaiellaceae bacterium]|nr:SMP-30/gluconolactonase/LRE family protein [Gaiellaceae bacterium]